MKWVTRERARVDRIACPWLITRFIDPAPEFLFVPADEVPAVAAREGAVPFDVPGVELGHHGARCSFDAFLEKCGLDDAALAALARVVRGADTRAPDLAPEAAGLYALASGFRQIARDDHDNMARQFPAYDALYAWCRARVAAAAPVLFVCLHGVAKSAVAAAVFDRLAAARGLALRADFAGLEPEPAFPPRVVSGCLAEGRDLRGAAPRRATREALRGARHVVALGCDVEALAPGVAAERWDVPAVGEG